jgi:hypothetical protein
MLMIIEQYFKINYVSENYNNVSVIQLYIKLY